MSNENFAVRFRPTVAAFPPYRQGAVLTRPGFKLSSNESPWEPLPAILQAVQQCSTFNRYADPELPQLRQAVAKKFAVEPAQIQFGAGSVALLFQLIHAVAGAGDNYVSAWPSFEAYPLLGLASGAEHVGVPLTAAARHDLAAMAQAIDEDTRAILLCSPNNPTGAVITEVEFVDFMARVPDSVLVILDEAYAEFVRDEKAVNGLRLLDSYPNLVVLRTFAKAQGLAGLRLGYGFADPRIWQIAAVTALPLAVSAVAEVAGVAALSAEAQIQLQGRVQLIVNRRIQLLEGLRELGLRPPQAEGNFVWLPSEQLPEVADQTDSAVALGEALHKADILVRVFPGNGVRISIGEAESVAAVLNTLRAYLATHGGK